MNSHLPPASLTKIATALVAVEQADLSAAVPIQIDGGEFSFATESTVMGLKPGQRLSLRDLLYGMLLPSGNDAALAIAEYQSGGVPAFVDLMNRKATDLGLSDTHFSNPHGLDDPGLYSSALDVAILGAELLRKPELAAIVQARTYQPNWDGPPVYNLNQLPDLYDGVIGVKIGYTDNASQTIVAAVERDGRRIIVSVLGSSNIYGDSIALFDWAFASTRPACSAGR